MANGLLLQIVGLLTRRSAQALTKRQQSHRVNTPDLPPLKFDTKQPSAPAAKAPDPDPFAIPHMAGVDGENPLETETIQVDVTEDGMVWIHGDEWELVVTPLEARELAEAIEEAADLAAA